MPDGPAGGQAGGRLGRLYAALRRIVGMPDYSAYVAHLRACRCPKVHLVEFFDPACETCAAFFPHVKKLLAANPDRIRLSVRHVPFHNGSVTVSNGDRYAMLLPDSQAKFTVEIDFPNPVIGRQRTSMTLDPATFAREIAPARTFGFAQDLQALRARGLAAGGSLRSAILVDGQRVVNEEGLRFPDEFVRHKLLDCVGDLSLLGLPVIAHLVTYKPGHQLCHQLLRAVHAAADAASIGIIGIDNLPSESAPSESSGEAVETVRSSILSRPQHGDRS